MALAGADGGEVLEDGLGEFVLALGEVGVGVSESEWVADSVQIGRASCRERV